MTDKVFPTYDLDSGLAANRPVTPTVSGGRMYCYVATDTHVISIWDGTEWGGYSCDGPLLVGTNASSGDDSAILIKRAITGSAVFPHAVRDESTINASGASGYACYDAIAVMSGVSAYNHLRGFQERLTYTGSSSIGEVAGFTSQPTINTGTVATRVAFKADDWLGTGVVTIQYGILINDLTKGVANYGLYSGSQTLASYHGGTWQIGSGGAGGPLLLGYLSATPNYGTLLTIDASGNVLYNPNVSFINGVLSAASTAGLTLQTSTNQPVYIFVNSAEVARFTATGLGIGGAAPAAGTILDLQSTTLAFMPPRMTTTQRNAITAVAGMAIYNSTTAQHEGYKNAAWGWVSLEGRLSVYTVATLPAGPVQGDQALVTDALAPAFLVAIAGGGAVKTPVYYDGTNWVAG